ncbi:MAG: OmpA family protein [Bacteroidota bacterium]|nr:OmpA family protein [Bacteroidota bacterium]
MKRLAILFFSLVLLQSCVSSKVHKDLQDQYSECQDENSALRKQNDEFETELKEARARIDRLEKLLNEIEVDTTRKGIAMRRLEKNYADLNRSYEFLLNNNNTLLANNARENKALLERLEDLQEQLQGQEDSLRDERTRLSRLSTELAARSKRVDELEAAIARKDSMVGYIRKSVSDALLGFQGKGLTVEMKNGRVYVSLENSLLFPSGSWTVTSKGQEALQELSKVLANNPDIQILVEGHTDDDPYRGSGQVSDNWDLSVMRATSVTKILLGGGRVDPKRITAAGRGEYVPLAPNDTAENKAKNRRTEVILTPKLEELMKVINE